MNIDLKRIKFYLRFLLSFPYQLVHSLRCLFYSFGLLQHKELDAYVISVGNFSFGGSGKTPFTLELAKELSEEGYKVSILSRGYKGSEVTNKPILLKHDNFQNYHPNAVGDEPYMMAKDLADYHKQGGKEINVVVCKDRYLAGIYASEELHSDLLILDDGQQHVKLDRDLSIILKNINNDGFFREFPWNGSKVDFLIHTKVDNDWIKANSGKDYIAYDLSISSELDPSKEICAFSALADNQSFFNLLLNHLSELVPALSKDKLQSIKSISFPDHHQFTIDEVRELISSGMNLICTQKDYVKIPDEYKASFSRADLIIRPNPLDLFTRIKEKVRYGTLQRNDE